MSADLIFLNARIRPFDSTARPGLKPDALAVRGNRILCLGQADDLRKLATGKTRIVDAQGSLLLPGFNDAHAHFLEGGFSLSNIDLRNAGSPEEFARRIADYARQTASGKWITGGEWDHERWGGAPLPHKNMIDKFTASNPVFVHRTDQHMALANSAALQLAGIGPDTADVPGGVIVRDADGEPTGLLKDAAMRAVWRVMPAPDTSEKIKAVKMATEYASSLGVTSVQDMSAGDDAAIYQSVADAGGLKTRIYGMYPISRWEKLAAERINPRSQKGLVRLGGLKGFSDGSLGSATAYFFDPYADDLKNRGLLADEMFPAGVMFERALAADRAGLQVLIHAIGDRANFEVLEIFRRIAEANGPRDRRPRIEHAQHLRPSEIPRFGAQQVIASVQPYHAVDDGRWCEPRLGAARLRGTYAFSSLLKTGASMAIGTDWTVAPLDPLLTLHAAVTRSTLDGKHPEGWLPEEKISIEEAVRAYTVGSAFAEFAEDEKGSLAAGKLADLVMIDNDFFEGDPMRIPGARVLMTVMDGRVVFENR
jgi:predicted amidohydrolase YtcJ